MKVRIFSGWISRLQDQFDCSLDGLSALIGLSDKTLRALEKGGEHKVETVHQLEQMIAGGVLGIWISPMDEAILPEELYMDIQQLDGATELKKIDGERCYALSLSSQGLLKLIEDKANRRTKHCTPEVATGASRFELDQRLLAFDNYRWNLLKSQKIRGAEQGEVSQDEGRGLKDEFRFTIQDSLFPLTKIQKQSVTKLDTAISDLIQASQQNVDPHSKSFLEQLERESLVSYRRALTEQIAKLKRLNINVLAYSRLNKKRLMDETGELSDQASYGIESNEYITTYYQGLTHIVLAPANILRVPFSIPQFELEWQPETMWSCKLKVNKDEVFHFDEVEGLGTDSRSLGKIEKKRKDNVLQLVSEKEESKETDEQ